MKSFAAFFVAATALGLRLQAAEPAPAASPKAAAPVHVMALPGGMEWKAAPPALPAGAQVVLLEGDPKVGGYFAMRIKLPPGYRVPPHFHPVQERVTVLEGTFLLGQGEARDEAALKEYPAGSYISMPAGMRHFAATKAGAVIQLTTIGPWGITYVDPADDPRNKK